MMLPETWLPVIGYEEKYEVSDQGRVRSLIRPGLPILSTSMGKKGYPRVLLLVSKGKRRSHNLHMVVARAHLGPRPDGLEVRHLDGVKTNCAVGNLRYGTSSENNLDTVLHGNHPMQRNRSAA